MHRDQSLAYEQLCCTAAAHGCTIGIATGDPVAIKPRRDDEDACRRRPLDELQVINAENKVIAATPIQQPDHRLNFDRAAARLTGLLATKLGKR